MFYTLFEHSNGIVKTGYGLDVYASASLYMSCADMEAGLKVFDFIPEWNVLACTSLIAGNVNKGRPRKSIEVLEDMEFWNNLMRLP